MTYDILHAAPNGPSGAVLMGFRNLKISGPQKALQSLTVTLLSSTRPLDSVSIKFIEDIKNNRIRDKARLSSQLLIDLPAILAEINTASRPDSEYITNVSILDVSSGSPDSISIRLKVDFRSGTSVPYELPVELA